MAEVTREELGPYYGICCYPGDRHEQRDPDPACECDFHETEATQ